ncbi:putative bifunctional diguanylate cyclase/phosphodiesterase [Geomonas propionica]|uniref:Bifunctional diguanylate cyclase/phosphodiesterase n=1 Tax=Geomonas propionica TaxID=2798582 RepID=A0ABS0YX20_9BACT|nr:bifunctional diguanylate cyclase/phosphodiesterase [Geomonas propionica]MBJ6802530.1 bifunctional diguanylate cyclase/phosphodiesterase [Geomonas propionica]
MDGGTLGKLRNWFGSLSPATVACIYILASICWLLFAHLLFDLLFAGRPHLEHLASGGLELLGVLTMAAIIYLLNAKIEARHRASELSIKEQAVRDGLTGLYNRQAFDDFLAQSIVFAKRRSESVALLFLDLDRFKLINDRRGHFVGDALLAETARRLTRCAMRGEDIVARVGGDEFAMLLRHPEMPEGPAVMARRVLDALAEPVQVEGETLKTSASIGIALFPADADEPMQLFKMADLALGQAKQQGRSTFCLYGGEWREERDHRIQLEHGLLRAINRGELFLVYQPKFDTASMRVVGVEALVRWRHPHLGELGPASFVPLAEKGGLIWPLTEWVLREACRQAAQWYRSEALDLNVAVNMSPTVFAHEELEQAIEAALHDSGLPPDRLTLEITEQSLMVYEAEAVGVLERLQRMGINVQIDDFGTGYSSLSSLKHYHFQALKIDKSFVSDVVTSSEDAAIATTIMFMSKCLDMEAIAEGVENEAQKDFLASIDCRLMQGFYFARPMLPSEMSLFISRLTPAKRGEKG